jgi:DNA-binding transcriptional regulator GbsR (MarR family)
VATLSTREPAERLALALTRAGLQRMTARLLAAFLFTDQPGLTMGDLADDLGVSPGSVSAGIKTLTSVGLIEQIPAPGSRRDHYRMRDDAWPTLFSTQNQVIRVMQEAADDGIAASGPNSVASRRLEDMRDFYAFMVRELPALVDRWQQHHSGRQIPTSAG